MVALAGTAKLPEGVEIQVKRLGGDWGAWQPLDTDDAIDNKTEPLWVGHSTAVRVRGAAQTGLALKLIDPGVKATDSPKQRAAIAAAAGRPVMTARWQWGADESVRTACFARQGIGIEYATTIKAATIHHTAGTNDYTAADSAAIMRGIYLFHAIDRDWCDVGYNFLVDKFGQIFEGRVGGLESPVWGAHAGGFNQFTFGVSMMGSFETTVAPSPEQLDAVASVVAWKFANGYRDPNGTVTLISGGGGTSKYPAGTPVTLPNIFAHRDVGNTECPGQLAYDLLPTIRQKVTERMGDWQASPIYQKWQAAGADAGPMQGPFRVEQDTARSGRYTTFANDNKSVYWSAPIGAKVIEGAIRLKWSQLGSESGVFGFPVTDEVTAPDTIGRYNEFEFQNGSIYWSPSTGAHSIQGPIKDKWTTFNREAGRLGYPITDDLAATGGRYNDFQKESASIYYSTATGAHSIMGAIKVKWQQAGKENSFLRYPTTDELVGANGGRYNDFIGEGGSVYWSSGTGAHSIQGAIKEKWVALNKEAGFLGYPTTDELATPRKVGRFNHFAGETGSIYWSPATGARSVKGAIKVRWGAVGWEDSYLGFPISDEYPAAGGLRSDFQGGYIFYSFATGQATDHRYP
jgi:uncharacterized protein with LGFP repeats